MTKPTSHRIKRPNVAIRNQVETIRCLVSLVVRTGLTGPLIMRMAIKWDTKLFMWIGLEG